MVLASRSAFEKCKFSFVAETFRILGALQASACRLLAQTFIDMVCPGSSSLHSADCFRSGANYQSVSIRMTLILGVLCSISRGRNGTTTNLRSTIC